MRALKLKKMIQFLKSMMFLLSVLWKLQGAMLIRTLYKRLISEIPAFCLLTYWLMDLCRCVTSCTLYLFQNSLFKFSFLIVNYARNGLTVRIPLSECRFVKYVFVWLSWYRYYNGRLWLTNVCRQGPSQFELECFFFRLCPYGWYFSAALYQRPSANKNKSVPVSFIFLFLFQLHK